MRRTLGRLGMAVTVGLAVMAVVLLPPPSSRVSLPASLSLAPREDCPVGIVRADSVTLEGYAGLMHGKLPTWLPEGFGFLQGYGPAYGGYAYGIWADRRCREFGFYASDVAAEIPVGPRVGAWTVTADVPDGCGNYVMGTGTCLSYTAVVSSGTYHLQMMGIDRDEGDRIARSVPLAVPFDGLNG